MQNPANFLGKTEAEKWLGQIWAIVTVRVSNQPFKFEQLVSRWLLLVLAAAFVIYLTEIHPLRRNHLNYSLAFFNG